MRRLSRIGGPALATLLLCSACGSNDAVAGPAATDEATAAEAKASFCAANEAVERGRVLQLQDLAALPEADRSDYANALRGWLTGLDKTVELAPPALADGSEAHRVAHVAYYGWLASALESGSLWTSEVPLSDWRGQVRTDAAVAVTEAIERSGLTAWQVASGAATYRGALAERCPDLANTELFQSISQAPPVDLSTTGSGLDDLLTGVLKAWSDGDFLQGKLFCGDLRQLAVGSDLGGETVASRVRDLADQCLVGSLDAAQPGLQQLLDDRRDEAVRQALDLLTAIGLVPAEIPAFVAALPDTATATTISTTRSR